MSELSPQAQEVFWAFNRAASGKPYDWHYLPAIAAALRSVAEQFYFDWNGMCCAEHLKEIARQLDASEPATEAQ